MKERTEGVGVELCDVDVESEPVRSIQMEVPRSVTERLTNRDESEQHGTL